MKTDFQDAGPPHLSFFFATDYKEGSWYGEWVFFFFLGDSGDNFVELLLRGVLLNGIVMDGGGGLVGRRNWGMVIDLERKGVMEGRGGYKKIQRGILGRGWIGEEWLVGWLVGWLVVLWGWMGEFEGE